MSSISIYHCNGKIHTVKEKVIKGKKNWSSKFYTVIFVRGATKIKLQVVTTLLTFNFGKKNNKELIDQ